MSCFFRVCLWIVAIAPAAFGQKAYNTRGSAQPVGNTDCYQITSATNNQIGAIWYADKVRLDKSFDLEFSMNFGTKDQDGADGMVFVIQTAGNNALGNTGQGMGYKGFAPSVGVEFDTWQNGDENDPTFDHIAVFKNGSVNHNVQGQLTPPVMAMLNNPDIEDGKEHNVRITWDARQNTLEVYFDCQKRISLNINLSKDVFFGAKEAWWGFTGATGGSNNLQTVCLRKDIVAKDTFQICRGERVELVARNSIDRRYTWSPRTFLTDADSPSPIAQPTRTQLYTVRYRDFCNEVTLDSILVEVTAPPTLDLGPDRQPCDTTKRLLLTPTLTPKINDVVYSWSNGASTDTTGVTKSGVYKLSVNAKGCKTSDSVSVIFRPTPVVPKVAEPYFCIRDAAVLLDAQATEPNLQFLWTPTRQTTPTIAASQSGKYSVSIKNEFGCGVVRSFNVRDDCPPNVFVPDVFTPNGDGQNDVFELKATEELTTELLIFNRWGEVVFKSNNLQNAWNGVLSNGTEAPADTYVWQLQYAQRRPAQPIQYERRGKVVLVR
jgi:gliding motility-associated-like protein